MCTRRAIEEAGDEGAGDVFDVLEVHGSGDGELVGFAAGGVLEGEGGSGGEAGRGWGGGVGWGF